MILLKTEWSQGLIAELRCKILHLRFSHEVKKDFSDKFCTILTSPELTD